MDAGKSGQDDPGSTATRIFEVITNQACGKSGHDDPGSTATGADPFRRQNPFRGTPTFGNWRNALAAAGLEEKDISCRREDVIRWLVAREQRELPRTEDAVVDGDPELHELACEHFGTWETALEHAGIDLAANLPYRKWDPEKVIEALQERHRQGLPMKGISGCDHALYCACFRYFGSIKKALKAAGIVR